MRLLETDRPEGFGCRLCVSLGTSRVDSYVWLTPDSFLALCEAGAWRAVAEPLPAQLQLAIAVTLGRLHLLIAQVRGLRTGDVLVPEQTFSKPRAAATCRLANSGCMAASTMPAGLCA